MNLDDEEEFCIPSELVEKIYDLSGGVDKYKGVIMWTCIECQAKTGYPSPDDIRRFLEK